MSQTGTGPGEDERPEHHDGLLGGFGGNREPGHDPDHDPAHHEAEHEIHLEAPHGRPGRERSRRLRGCLPLVAFVLVLAALSWFGGRWAYDEISARFGPAPDYAGPGTGTVMFEVEKGASSTDIARKLKAERVVKSVDAFNEAATKEERSRNIQVGYYELKRQMKASEALDVLVDPKNLLQSLVVVPEGARVRDVVKTIAAKTDIPKKDVTAALADPKAIGLPAVARGNPEGYLYPATYNVPPKQTAVGLIRQMVAKTVDVGRSLDIESQARELGLTPEEVLTVASIIEYEANVSKDYPKVARVLYNRLKKDMALQLDSTVAYVSKREGDVWTTAAERADKSEYNTYAHTGLPPGPIGSPGEATIKAALEPASGSWLYFVPDYEAKTTRFSSTYSEHQKWVKKLQEYCRSSEDC